MFMLYGFNGGVCLLLFGCYVVVVLVLLLIVVCIFTVFLFLFLGGNCL